MFTLINVMHLPYHRHVVCKPGGETMPPYSCKLYLEQIQSSFLMNGRGIDHLSYSDVGECDVLLKYKSKHRHAYYNLL